MRGDESAACDQRYRMALEAAPIALLMVDRSGRITLVNRELERLFGYARGELLGCDVEMLVPERLRGEHVRFRGAYQGTPQERKMGEGRELYGLRKDGVEVPIEVGLTPLDLPDGAQVLSAIVDLTYRKRVEQERAAQAAELERSNAELEQFAYVASHDLQEPVRIIRSYAEFLGQRYAASFDDKGRKYLGYIVEGAERMHQLTGDLLRYSRVGRGELQRAQVDTNALVDRVIALFVTGIHAQPGAQITRADLPPVFGAETLLAQLFQNLVSNALKFRRDEPPRVRIEVDDAGADWRFAVHDNGIGIEARHAERVFQLFQRLHERSRYPGTGIGLAIAKRIVERHAGRIWLQSNPGNGSSFYFTLAKRAASQVPDR